MPRFYLLRLITSKNARLLAVPIITAIPTVQKNKIGNFGQIFEWSLPTTQIGRQQNSKQKHFLKSNFLLFHDGFL